MLARIDDYPRRATGPATNRRDFADVEARAGLSHERPEDAFECVSVRRRIV